jgi:hypothetical protein
MSPTVLSQQIQQQQTQAQVQPKKAAQITNIKEQLSSKRIILCQSSRDESILKGYLILLKDYPQWFNQIALVFLSKQAEVTEEDERGKNVYYFDKEATNDLLKSTAAVNIIKSADNNQVTIVDAITLNQVKLKNSFDYTNIANVLNKALVSYFIIVKKRKIREKSGKKKKFFFGSFIHLKSLILFLFLLFLH